LKAIYNTITEKMLIGSHTLIAGTTGSGKTVVLNNIIYQLIQKPPTEARLILIDPKRVGLSRFKWLPHIRNYCTESHQAINALKQAIDEMEHRYRLIDIGIHPTSTLYIIIDELADLMVTDRKQIMPLLQRLLQLGREAKIKLIVATQAPSRKIIPAELTLNIDTRLALRCVSPIESRQIISRGGAETLPRYGRGILRTCYSCEVIEIELIADADIENLIQFWESTQ